MFRNVDELKKYLSGVQKSLSDKTIMPFVESAAIKYIVPAIGAQFYQELQTAALVGPGEAEPEAKVKIMIVLVQRSLAYYTLLEAMPFLTVSVGDLGIVELSPRDNMPVRQWNYFNLENATFGSAEVFLDNVLVHLESFGSDYPTWLESPECTVSQELFINSTSELARYLPIGTSRRAYQVLRPYLVRAEDLYIQPALGPALYAKLKTLQKDDQLGDEYLLVVEKFKKALAQYALMEALPEISIQFAGDGFRVLSSHEGIKGRLAATEKDLSARIVKAHQMAAAYMALAQQYLDASYAKLPEYAETYQARRGTTPTYQLPDNSNSPSFRIR